MMEIVLTVEQKRAWKVIRPLLAQVLESQLEEERHNPFVGEMSVLGCHLRRVYDGRLELLDELLPEMLDPIFDGEPELEPEPKKVRGVPFPKKQQ